MIRLGWIDKIASRWTITERGKIVLAIETGRRAKRRSQTGYLPRRPTLISFVLASV